jgi:hypothetical protein
VQGVRFAEDERGHEHDRGDGEDDGEEEAASARPATRGESPTLLRRERSQSDDRRRAT